MIGHLPLWLELVLEPIAAAVVLLPAVVALRCDRPRKTRASVPLVVLELGRELSPALFGRCMLDALGIARRASPRVTLTERSDGSIAIRGAADTADSGGRSLPAHSVTIESRVVRWAWSGLGRVRGVAAALARRPLPAVRLAVVVVARTPDGASLLLTRRVARRGGTFSSTWVFPGGHVDAGESLHAAAARELYEETGARVELASIRTLGLFQAASPLHARQWAMVVCAGTLAAPLAPGEIRMQVSEVGAACLLPAKNRALLRALASNVRVATGTLSETEFAGATSTGHDAPSKTQFAARDVHAWLGRGHRFALDAWLRDEERRLRV